jgi:hypothetical protein
MISGFWTQTHIYIAMLVFRNGMVFLILIGADGGIGSPKASIYENISAILLEYKQTENYTHLLLPKTEHMLATRKL